MKNLPEMVERVGIAIHEVPRFPLETQLQRTAHAAIEAMMEPTDAMLSVGARSVSWNKGPMNKARGSYVEMLREALSPSLKEQEDRTP